MRVYGRPQPQQGVFDAPYWEYARQGDLRLQRCAGCDAFRYPPAPVCPECLSPGFEWAPLSGRGRVLAWTVFHRQYFPELPPPYTVVAVETAEGPIVIGNFVNANGRKAACGDAVKLTYEEVAGELETWTICQWEPAEEGS